VLLIFGAPCQLRWLAGREHGRTIPLADKERIEIQQRPAVSMACYPLIRLEQSFALVLSQSLSGNISEDYKVFGA
jgi:hypothetical protein